MHAFLIVGNPAELVGQKIENILLDQNAKRLDFPIQKIADVRDLKDFTKTSLGQKTAIVVSDFSEASEDSQNALLKSLEEPQQNIIYILTSKSLGGILSTIISRCELIEIHDGSTLNEKEMELATDFLEASVGERLASITKIKDRQEAGDFLTKLLVVGHKLLLKGQCEAEKLTEINKCAQAIKANGNVQLQLTNMVIKLSK